MVKVPEDPLEAAMLKEKNKQKRMYEAKKRREASQQEGYISKSVQFKEGTKSAADQEDYDDQMDDEFYDSDELVYDSEEEAEAERKFQQQQRKQFGKNGQSSEVVEPMEGYDANVEVKKVQRYRPAPGVKFAEFDEYGLSKKEGLGQFISTDNSIPDVFIEAPAEMMEKAMRPIGVFRDYDKPVEELTNEGKYFASDSTSHLSKIDLI